MDVALVLAAGEHLLSPTMVMVLLLLRGTASEKNDDHERTTRNTTKYESIEHNGQM